MGQNPEREVPFDKENTPDTARGSRKEHPQYATDLPVKFSVDGQSWVSGKVGRISIVNLSLETEMRIPAGSPVVVELPLEQAIEGEESVKVAGKIVFCRRGDPLNQHEIAYNSMEEDERAIVIELVAQLLMNGKARSLSKG